MFLLAGKQSVDAAKQHNHEVEQVQPDINRGIIIVPDRDDSCESGY
jgi:hypothetical protein